MSKKIEIVDRGRGLQLSTSRITVQDLVPYFQQGASYDEIMRWIPTLTPEEIAVVESYYQEHKAELDEQDRRIRERSAQRKNPAWGRGNRRAGAEQAPGRHGGTAPRESQRGSEVKGIIADVNIQGQVDLLVAIMQVEPWKIFWDNLKLPYLRFADVGLAPDAADSQVWDACQQQDLVLITDNRNDGGPGSLEATIRSKNTPSSLPVLTIANVPHLGRSRQQHRGR